MSIVPLFYAVNIISILGCILVFYKIYKTRRPLKIAIRRILLLNTSDFALNLVNIALLFLPATSENCNILGPIKTFTVWISFYWCYAISLLVYLTMKGCPKARIESIFVGVNVSSILASFGIALLYFILLIS